MTDKDLVFSFLFSFSFLQMRWCNSGCWQLKNILIIRSYRQFEQFSVIFEDIDVSMLWSVRLILCSRKF